MSTDLEKLPTSIEWQPVGNWFERMRHASQSIEHDLWQAYDALELMCSRLALDQRRLAEERADLDERRAHFEETCRTVEQSAEHSDAADESLRGQLAVVREQLEQAERDRRVAQESAQTLQRTQADACQLLNEQLAALREEADQQIESLTGERDRLQARCEQLAQQESPADATDEVLRQLADRQSELDACNDQLHQVQQQLAAQVTATEELTSQRDALEEELEQVRHRAADLDQSLAETREDLRSQKANWSQELKQMRAVLVSKTKPDEDAQSARATHPQSCHETMLTPATPRRAEEQVVGSVMAQFEKLRNQRADNRTRQRSKM